MNLNQKHRGPDAEGIFINPGGEAGLGHTRLSIIDLSDAGRQPMSDASGRFHVAFNGEVYNYLELRKELNDYPFRTRTDTEVLLAAYCRWGNAALDRLIGMFAFLIWDERKKLLFAARDRFGVKPLYYASGTNGTLRVASEIRALHEAGVPAVPDSTAWSNYLTTGLHEQSARTFWQGIHSLPPGHWLEWKDGQTRTACWYDVAERSGPDFDTRPVEQVREEYLALLAESVKLRFRADVPVGIAVSGGLDSCALIGLVGAIAGRDSEIEAFTYVTGDPRYDELPWVQRMLKGTYHRSIVNRLSPEAVPALAESVQRYQSEPFGGFPTLAYAGLFEQARERGVIVLMDGQGMDEQWAGYDYYENAVAVRLPAPLQGSRQRTLRPECLCPEFRARAEPLELPAPYSDALRNRQYWDIRYSKLPRALRFNDRVSMRSSTELREPFLDHRLFELALRQPPERKIHQGKRKWLLRNITEHLIPGEVIEAPKRPVQTPQREWLQGPLRGWAEECIEAAFAGYGREWLVAAAVRREWRDYCSGKADNSFYVWQWVSLGMMSRTEVACVE